MGVKGHSGGGLGTPRRLALGRSCLIPKADERCSQDGLEAMLDRQYVGLMLYLPDVADEFHDDQAKVALRRYEAWRRAVEKLLDGGNKAS